MASKDEKAIEGIEGRGSRKPTPFEVFLNASKISFKASSISHDLHNSLVFCYRHGSKMLSHEN
jgi:hypothetical protein